MVGPGSALSRARRARELDEVAGGAALDLLVVGGGITGVGLALDAATRGLSVALVERHDLASGTSRWSSKLVHGGLRYLATGDVGIARESAVERHVLMTRTAPHLVTPMAQLVPLLPGTGRAGAALVRTGFLAGDALRRSAGTGAGAVPRSRRVSPGAAAALAPAVRRDGLRGGLVAWDGRLVDVARVVVAVARTAAAHGARVLTRVSAHEVTGDGALLRDGLTGATARVRARAVVSAAGVWAAQVVPSIGVRPSRGTHLVVPAAAVGGLAVGLMVPVPGELNRFVFALPAGGGRVHVGLTDEDAPGPPPDVPTATPAEVDFLLDTVNAALATPLGRGDVLGTYSGLRPLLDTGAGGATADVSRRHAVLTSPDGVLSVVGGKLTTYRRMAEDGVDAAAAAGGLAAGPCRTARLPLVGAARRAELAGVAAPRRLVERYGTEAPAVHAAGPEPVAPGTDVTRGELAFGVACEGALDAADLLERRTRLGVVTADGESARPAAEQALAQ
ncbi:glycerol-3-phosphate dehydrogenase/oxidase [Rhodococcus aerolatus]